MSEAQDRSTKWVPDSAFPMFKRIFTTVNDEERLIPSDAMILEVCVVIPKRDYVSFMERSNRYVDDYKKIWFNPHAILEMTIWHAICVLSDFPFDVFYKAQLEMGWYSCLTTGGSSPRKTLKELSEFVEISESVLIYGYIPKELEGFRDEILDPRRIEEDRAMRFEFYRQAFEVIDNLIHLAGSRAKEEPALNDWLHLLDTHTHIQYKQIRDAGIFLKEHWTLCRFCGAYITYEIKQGRHGEPATCGSPECVKAYNNSKPSRITKAKEFSKWLESKGLPPKSEWKRSRCKGFGCPKNKLLEPSTGFCEDCLRKHLGG